MPDAEKDASPWPCVTHGVAGCEKCWPRVAPPAELDAAVQEAARLFGMGAIECPGCGETKYIGHGPLCLTCYSTRVTSPAAGGTDV